MGHTTQLGETFVPLRKRHANHRDGRSVLDRPTEGKASLPLDQKIAISKAAMCEGKPTYATAAKAWATLRVRNRRHGKKARNPALEPYRCPHCGQWHIGGR